MHSFEVDSNESACRKVDVLGWNNSITTLVDWVILGKVQYALVVLEMYSGK